jgi:hypothetical protein
MPSRIAAITSSTDRGSQRGRNLRLASASKKENGGKIETAATERIRKVRGDVADDVGGDEVGGTATHVPVRDADPRELPGVVV